MSKEIDDHLLRLYQPKKLLGSGAYGHVWKVIDKRTKKQLALKKIFDAFQNSTDAQRTYRQITILTQIQHPNIIKLDRVIRAKNNKDLYLAFQFMEADLHSLVGENTLQGVHLRFITYQILRALQYLHSAQLLHRDLKPSNVLINSECQVKVCDFGLARTLTCEQTSQMILTEEVATRWYRSPQMLLGSRSYSKPTDVWSVGCIIAELLIGKPLFPGNSTLHQLQKIIQFTGVPSQQNINSLECEVAQSLLNQINVKRKPPKDYFKSCDHQLILIVMKMLEFNPHKRITIQQALRSKCLMQFWQKQEQSNLNCNKFLAPFVDDNVKLTLQQYRKIIYQDIERRYPQQNTVYKNLRSNESFTKINKHSVQTKLNHSPPKGQLKRQKSMIHVNKHGSNNQILKKIENSNPYKAVLQKEEAKKLRGQQNKIKHCLQKTVSKTHLVKKGGKPTKFKK